MAIKFKWPSKRLGEFAEFRNGVNYNKSSFGVGVKVVGVSDFQDYIRPRYAELEQINPEGIVSERNILRHGDIVFVRSNGNRELIGRSLFIEKPPEEVTHSAFTIRVRFTDRNVFPKFFAYCFRTPMIRHALTAYGGGTNISNLNQDILSALEIPSPPLLTQRKIAAILTAYDDLIENNLRRIKILEEMAQNLYREWFVKFRFPVYQHARFTDSTLGRIPEGWEVKTVENTFVILGGGTPSKAIPEYWNEGTINWYSPTDLTATGSMFMERSGNQISELGLKKSSARLFPPFSVMMTSRATLGVISINITEACTNQGFITCVPNERFMLYTLFYWLKENVEYFISLGTGATFKEITKGVFKTIELVVPAQAIVTKFEDTVQQFTLQVLNLQRKNTSLRRTRDLLLPRLISGEVDVSELGIAVPEEAGA
jgi:type I restriction enzyme S subunit